MSTRAVIIALIIAVVLSAAAFLVLTRPGAAEPEGIVPAGERVVRFDPARVEAIRVVHPDGRIEVVERQEQPGQWRLLLIGVDGPGAGADRAWPVMPQRVRSILQVLSDTRASATPDADASVGETPLTVALVHNNGAEVEIRFADRSIGGSVLVETSRIDADQVAAAARRALIPDNVRTAFTSPGPRGWRETAVFHDLRQDPTRITFENELGRLSLARVEGRWRLREPVASPANTEAVEALVGAVNSLSITSFHDEQPPSPERTGLDRLSARLVAETDLAVPDGPERNGRSVRTIRREILIGQPADTAGREVYAALLTGDDAERAVVRINAAQLGEISMDATRYIAPVAAAVEAADVGAVAVESLREDGPPARTFRKTIDGWAEDVAGEAPALLSEPETQAVERAVALLTRTGSLSVSIGPPTDYQPLAELTLRSLSDNPLETVELGTAEVNFLAVRTGVVYRMYGIERVPSVLREFVTPPRVEQPDRPADPRDDPK